MKHGFVRKGDQNWPERSGRLLQKWKTENWAAEEMHFTFAAITRQFHGVVCRKAFHSEKALSTAKVGFRYR